MDASTWLVFFFYFGRTQAGALSQRGLPKVLFPLSGTVLHTVLCVSIRARPIWNLWVRCWYRRGLKTWYQTYRPIYAIRTRIITQHNAYFEAVVQGASFSTNPQITAACSKWASFTANTTSHDYSMCPDSLQTQKAEPLLFRWYASSFHPGTDLCSPHVTFHGSISSLMRPQ